MLFYVLYRRFGKPDTSRLKWTRKDDAILSDGVTRTTKATQPIPIPSICNDHISIDKTSIIVFML